MGRPSLALVLVLLLLNLLSPAAATALESDVIEEQVVYSVGGRRGLLQSSPASPPNTIPDPTPTPTAAANPPAQAANPPTEAVNPPTQAVNPPTQAANPPTQAAIPPTTAIPPVGAAVPPAVTPAFPPILLAPAPAPIGVTSRQKNNAIIAVSVVGGVILIGIICIFCRCQCFKRSKKLPFQRLQMT